MHHNTIKLHKHSMEPIFLEVRNNDGRVLKITGLDFFLNVYDPISETLLISRRATIEDDNAGRVKFTFLPSDLLNISNGIYNYSIRVLNTLKDNEARFLYVNQNYEVTGIIEIMDNGYPTFRQSTEITSFRPFNLIFSEAFPYSGFTVPILSFNSGRYSNVSEKNGQHSNVIFSIQMTDFVGYLIYQTSNNEDPSDHYDWVWQDCWGTGLNYKRFDQPTTTTEVYTIVGNWKWSRWLYVNEPTINTQGKIDKIIFR